MTDFNWVNVNESIILIDAVTADDTSTPMKTSSNRVTFQFIRSGTVNFTLEIEASMDASDWDSVFSKAYTTAGSESYTSQDRYRYWRAKCSSYVSGTASVKAGA